jgi:hypothetical protein
LPSTLRNQGLPICYSAHILIVYINHLITSNLQPDPSYPALFYRCSLPKPAKPIFHPFFNHNRMKVLYVLHMTASLLTPAIFKYYALVGY